MKNYLNISLLQNISLNENGFVKAVYKGERVIIKMVKKIPCVFTAGFQKINVDVIGYVEL